MKSKTIQSQHSRHTLCAVRVQREQVAEAIRKNEDSAPFPRFYEVRNWDAEGVTFFTLAVGHPDAPNEWCVFYQNGQMWTSFGETMAEAINGAQRDGWLYTKGER